MQSFRSEIENPIVEKDIIELEQKIRLHKEGKGDELGFRSLRLARGIYGQRQRGVQMVRIKLPYGKITSEQLHSISDITDKYSTGRLHITTRQDIQVHHVSLDKTPELWTELEQNDMTLREACGNTVRNITASETAGIDVDELFDVTPYAHALFEFFLRNPICQQMGRKIKISFSATDDDTALSYMHDIGFIPKIKDGKRGFKVLVAGGLGAQPRYAEAIHEFLEEDKIIPFTESVLRVFDRYGERAQRTKARMKYLLKDLGLDNFRKLLAEEQEALSVSTFKIDTSSYDQEIIIPDVEVPNVSVDDDYELWKENNVIPQKQKGLYAVGVKVRLGDFYSKEARLLADLIKNYSANELRFSIRQSILIRHVKEELLPFFYVELQKLGFADVGYNKTIDISSCPGTDTCNLGVSSSTGISTELEEVLSKEYPGLSNNSEILIKISGCMNSCGQHAMAHIGFNGVALKQGNLVVPGLQVLLGGGTLGNGEGNIAEKICKIPSKRGPDALRAILDDFIDNNLEDETFISYCQSKGKKYFKSLLSELTVTSNLNESDFIDWGSTVPYSKFSGVGEGAGVVIDLVSTLLNESNEKLVYAYECMLQNQNSDSIYHSYTSIINTAKALLISENVVTNTYVGIISDFDELFSEKIDLGTSFSEFIYRIKTTKASKEFANTYLKDAKEFYKKAGDYRLKFLKDETSN